MCLRIYMYWVLYNYSMPICPSGLCHGPQRQEYNIEVNNLILNKEMKYTLRIKCNGINFKQMVAAEGRSGSQREHRGGQTSDSNGTDPKRATASVTMSNIRTFQPGCNGPLLPPDSHSSSNHAGAASATCFGFECNCAYACAFKLRQAALECPFRTPFDFCALLYATTGESL
jgi:hypothetical protein